MIVDDEIDFLESLKEMFEIEGYVVITADNGNNAIKQFQKHLPSLVIMDVNMPKMNGIDAFFEIKKQYENANIILLSGNEKDKRTQEAFDYGLLDYLKKPVSIKLLKKITNNYANSEFSNVPSQNDHIIHAIELGLLEMGSLELMKVRNMLHDQFDCTLRDCCEHPHYLKKILCDLFGKNYDDILLSINQYLKLQKSKEIIKFKQVMSS